MASGQADRERRAQLDVRVHLDGAAMGAGDLAHDEESQPEAARVRALRTLPPAIRLEQVLLDLRRDRRAVVMDPDFQGPLSVAGQGDRDWPAGRAVVEGVRSQVRDHLRDAIA